jgi:hypothetical protein
MTLSAVPVVALPLLVITPVVAVAAFLPGAAAAGLSTCRTRVLAADLGRIA